MRSVEWEDGAVKMIDQRALPWKLETVRLHSVEAVAESIRNMTVRGAPAIGASAAFGMALAARQSQATTVGGLLKDLQRYGDLLNAARPTAVNLAWAVSRLLQIAQSGEFNSVDDLRGVLLIAAQQIADDDVAINRRIGAWGSKLIDQGATVLHHCNTGALATVDYGTALGVIRAAHEAGKNFHVLLDETRPRLQGSRLSAWELEQLGISYDIIPDTAAGYYMQNSEVDVILVGADRVAANGDFANKIGTYQLAIMAAAHNIPFYSVAPTSTIDLNLATGADIPIELRDPAEVTTPYGNPIVPPHFKARNPAFDVTPQHYLSGIVTENGIARPPFVDTLRRAVSGDRL
ncbi:MAG: S-methyl-5-thioribose-1-phosphate isomerase [Chloroflexi bacterium]|nr:S-methyl-5-thioribose-1-phosphate isomerase [Chloroflexota bacterium]